MVRPAAVWFMEGVSSQKDILKQVKQARTEGDYVFTLIASHRNERPEILSEADFSYIEPADNDDLLSFITSVCEKHNVVAIHAGKRGWLMEKMRADIETLGVKLTTGACHVDTFELADNKTLFSEQMFCAGLASVKSIQVQTPEEVSDAISSLESKGLLPCIKPVRGIYGMGFWVLKRSVKQLAFFNNPEHRHMHPDILLTALRSAVAAQEELPLQIVMPYLPGPERSTDMLVEKGRVIAAVARRKAGSVQAFENEGAAFQLAQACAHRLGADGLINIQTRDNDQGEPVLLEANLRPSGGIGYTAFSGINLPGLFALRQLGLLNDSETTEKLGLFKSLQVISTHNAKPLPVVEISTPDNVSSEV
ncbi:ATP-grasp domain-containing protein [Pantoea sp. FN0307]|uniref:ATP-grasp domain-containing protein n=1 Tax=Pantoea sp. FN0307 TaxID=3418560 RepID=UPI003CE82FFC